MAGQLKGKIRVVLRHISLENGDLGMKLVDMWNYSLEYLKTESLRSWLTIVGIVIGIATVLTLLSVASALEEDVKSQLESFGNNNLMVIPINLEQRGTNFMAMGQRATSGKLFERDFDRIKNLPGIKYASRVIYGRSTVCFRDKCINSPVYAGDPEVFDMWPDYLALEKGRYFTSNDKHVVVLGYDAANELFGDYKVNVNNQIEINGVKYRVVGIIHKIGTTLSKMDDSAIYIPYKDGREMFSGYLMDDEINIIMLGTEDDADLDELSETIETKIMQSHRVNEDNKDFSVVSSEFVGEVVSGILNLVTGFILLISLVSAFVGGLGISNTMFMSVLNRTREIGILKSLGARNRDILVLFIIESIILGLVGGILGTLLGVGVILVIPHFGLDTQVSVVHIGIVLIFAILVGVIAGILPARKASKVPPIEAISY